MQIIAHRRNTIEELVATPKEYGIEIDLRSYGDRLIVHHEPFTDAEDFEEWIKYYNHKTLILNVKEEGIEYRVKDIVEKKGITDYFFLDLSFPYLIKMINTGEKRVAVRFSEYESLEMVLSLTDKAEWVWIDCFTKMPINQHIYEILKTKNFKLCLVSPDLLNRPNEIEAYREYIMTEHIDLDAVCVKMNNANIWQ
jgi:hypothetical protein